MKILFIGNEDLFYTNIASVEKTTVFSNGSLIISTASKNDEGLYKCNASNGVGNALEATMVLRVIGMK